MATYIRCDIAPKDRLSLLLPSRLFHFLVPCAEHELVLSKEQIALEAIAFSRCGKAELSAPSAVLVLLRKVQSQTTRLAINARGNPLHKVRPASLTEEPIGAQTAGIAGVNGEAGSTPGHPGLESANFDSIDGQQGEVHLQDNILHRKVGCRAGCSLGEGGPYRPLRRGIRGLGEGEGGIGGGEKKEGRSSGREG